MEIEEMVKNQGLEQFLYYSIRDDIKISSTYTDIHDAVLKWQKEIADFDEVMDLSYSMAFDKAVEYRDTLING